MTIASPKGGEAPLDPASVEMFKEDEIAVSFHKNQESLWKNTVRLADIVPRVNEFDAIFYVGGHGRTFPFPSLLSLENERSVIFEILICE